MLFMNKVLSWVVWGWLLQEPKQHRLHGSLQGGARGNGNWKIICRADTLCQFFLLPCSKFSGFWVCFLLVVFLLFNVSLWGHWASSGWALGLGLQEESQLLTIRTNCDDMCLDESVSPAQQSRYLWFPMGIGLSGIPLISLWADGKCD